MVCSLPSVRSAASTPTEVVRLRLVPPTTTDSRPSQPKGAVSRTSGAYREGDGVSERALFVVDRNGTIFWSYCSPVAVNPGADGILDALERLSEQEARHEHAEGTGH